MRLKEQAATGSHFDLLSANYDASREHAQGRTFPFIARVLADEIPSGALVLDVGCGPGHLPKYLLDRGFTVVGCDLAWGMLQRAKANCVGRSLLAQASVTQLPFKSGTFGAVTMRFVAQHLDNLALALDEIKRVLTARGVIVVSDTVAPADAEARLWQDRIERKRDTHHRTLLTQREWCAVLARSGFLVGRQRRYVYPQDLHNWAQRVAMSLPQRWEMAAAFRKAPSRVKAAFEIQSDGDSMTWRWTQLAISATKQDRRR